MRYVYFNHLRIVNFLSVGKKPVEITFKPGLNIITGRNYDKADRVNGIGKSTIADAVHFALYGTTIRDLLKDNIANDQAPDSLCEVELEFNYHQDEKVVACKIIRTLNPTKCFFIVDGVDVTRSGVPQTTQLIVDTIKTSSEVFQNSVIMSVNNTIPFMAQKKVEKRKFIEGILGLEVFGNMLLQARSDFNDSKKELELEATKIAEIERSLADATKQKDAYEDTKKKKLDVLITRQTNNEQEISNINEKLAKFEPVDKEALNKLLDEDEMWSKAKEAYTTKLQSIKNLVTVADTTIKYSKDRLKKLKQVDSKCPHCGKDLAEAANAQYLKDKTELDAEIYTNNEILVRESAREKKVSDGLKDIVTSHASVTNKINDFRIRRKEVENFTVRVNQLKLFQNQVQTDIDQLSKESNNYQEIIDGITTRQNTVKTVITGLQETLDIIENAKFITSEEGVKSFIVKKILVVLNTRLATYLRRLESNSCISFNEFFEETITNERGRSCSYNNFSGAERKAIDLAMLFTFQDIRRAQADVWLNLSMFDELFDTSLDEKGIELVLDILKERVDMYNESIYIISHRKESRKYCNGGEVVFLEKKNGITTRTTDYEFS